LFQSLVSHIGLLGIIFCSQTVLAFLQVPGARAAFVAEMPSTSKGWFIPTREKKPSPPETSKIPILKCEQADNANKIILYEVKQDTAERNALSNTTAHTDHTNDIILAEITDSPVTPKKLALIQDLLKKKNSDLRLEAMLANMEETLPTILATIIRDRTPLEGDDLLKRVTATTQRMVKRYRELLPSRVDIGEITETITTNLYAKYYTEQELQDLIDFYETPTGRKAIATLPQLTEEAIKQSNDMLLPEITQLLKTIMQEEFGPEPFKPNQENKSNIKF